MSDMPSVHGKKLDNIVSKNIDGVVGIASDLIKYDKKYQEIILNLLGRTVIVENMDSAIALAKANNYSFRIVTLDGDVINPSGAISGGSVAQKTVNILGRSSTKAIVISPSNLSYEPTFKSLTKKQAAASEHKNINTLFNFFI